MKRKFIVQFLFELPPFRFRFEQFTSNFIFGANYKTNKHEHTVYTKVSTYTQIHHTTKARRIFKQAHSECLMRICFRNVFL